MEIYLPPWILLLLPGWIIIRQFFFEGLSETANKGESFDQHLLNEKSKDHFIDETMGIALFATQIPLSILTNLFHQRFEKHSMLESMLEILQQFYIQVATQSGEFHLFAGDLPTYTLRCKRCGQRVTLHGSIGDWRNSIPCTCCNVISLEHDWTQWWANSQRINVDATSFCLLWKLCSIIKIFPRRLELDGGFKHLSKTN